MAGTKQGKGKKSEGTIEQIQNFYHESVRFINKCSKPNKKGNAI